MIRKDVGNEEFTAECAWFVGMGEDGEPRVNVNRLIIKGGKMNSTYFKLVLKQLGELLHQNKPTPLNSDGIGVTVKKITLLFDDKSIPGYQKFIPRQWYGELLYGLPTIEDMRTGIFDSAREELPQIDPEYFTKYSHLEKRIKLGYKMLRTGTFEGEPYELDDFSYQIKPDHAKFVPNQRVISPHYVAVVYVDVITPVRNESNFMDFLLKRFKQFRVSDVGVTFTGGSYLGTYAKD